MPILSERIVRVLWRARLQARRLWIWWLEGSAFRDRYTPQWLIYVRERRRNARAKTPILYRIDFTDEARGAAEAVASTAVLEGYARRQIAWVCGEGFEHLWGNILFHTFEWPGTEREFIIRPIARDAMEIDVVAAWDSLGEYDTGLLPPSEFRMPRSST
jgi:hypothetical protein